MDRSVFACVLISFICISGITASLQKGSDTTEETATVSEKFQDVPAVEEPSELVKDPQDNASRSQPGGPSDSKDRFKRFPMTNQYLPQFQQYRQEQQYDLCPQMSPTCPTCISHVSQLPSDICQFPVVIKVLLLSAPTIDNVGRICGKFGLLSAHSHTDIRQFRRLLRFSSRDSCGCILKPSQQYFLISQLTAFIKDGKVYSKVSLSDQAILLSVDRFTESDVLNLLRCSERSQYPQQYVSHNVNQIPSQGQYLPQQPSFVSQSSVYEYQTSNAYNVPASQYVQPTQASYAPAPLHQEQRPNITYQPYQPHPQPPYQTDSPAYQESPIPYKDTFTQYQTPRPLYQTLSPSLYSTDTPQYQEPPVPYKDTLTQYQTTLQPPYQTSYPHYQTHEQSGYPPLIRPRPSYQTHPPSYEQGGYPPLIRPRQPETSYEHAANLGTMSFPAPIDQSNLYRQPPEQYKPPEQYVSNITPQPYVPPSYAPQPAPVPEPYKNFQPQAPVPYFPPLPSVFSHVPPSVPYVLSPTSAPCPSNSSVPAPAYSSRQEIPSAYNLQEYVCFTCPRITRISPRGLEDSFCHCTFAYLVAFTLLDKPNTYTDHQTPTCQRYKAKVLYDVANERPIDKNVEYLMFSHCPGLLNNFGSVIMLLLGFNIPPPSGSVIELTENFELMQLPSPSTVVLPTCRPFPYGPSQHAQSQPVYHITANNSAYAAPAASYSAPEPVIYSSQSTPTEYTTYGSQPESTSGVPEYVETPKPAYFPTLETQSSAYPEETPYVNSPSPFNQEYTSEYPSPSTEPTTSSTYAPSSYSPISISPSIEPAVSPAAHYAPITYAEQHGQSQSSFVKCPVGARTNSFECPSCRPYWNQQDIDDFCSSEFRIAAEVLTSAQISRQKIDVPSVSITKNVAENNEKTIIIDIESRPKSCIEGSLRIIQEQGISSVYAVSNILPFVFLSECSCGFLVANPGTKLLISNKRPPHVLHNGVIQFTNDTQVTIAHYGALPECLPVQHQMYDRQEQPHYGKPTESAYASPSSTTIGTSSPDTLYLTPGYSTEQTSSSYYSVTPTQTHVYEAESATPVKIISYHNQSYTTEGSKPYIVPTPEQYYSSEKPPSSERSHYETNIYTPQIVAQAESYTAAPVNNTSYQSNLYLPPAPPPPYNAPYQAVNPLYDACPLVSHSCPRCMDVIPENFANVYCISGYVLVVATGLENYQQQRENEDPRSIPFRQQNKLSLDVRYDGARNIYNYTVTKDNTYGQRGGQISSGNFCHRQRVKSLHEISQSVTPTEKIFDFDIYLHGSCSCPLFDNSPSYAMIMSFRRPDFNKPIQLSKDFVFFKIREGKEVDLPTCGYSNPGVPYASSPGHVIKYNEAKTSDYQCYDKHCPECNASTGVFNVPCNAKFVALVEVIESSASRYAHPVLEILKNNLGTAYPQVKIRVKSQSGKAQSYRESSYDSNYIPGAGSNECTHVKVKIVKDFSPEPAKETKGTLTVVGKAGCSCHFLGPDSKYALLVSEYVPPADRVVSALQFKPVCIGEGLHSIALCKAWYGHGPHNMFEPQHYIQPNPLQPYNQPKPYIQQKPYNQPKPSQQSYNQLKPYPQSYNTTKSYPQSYNQSKPNPQPYIQPKPYPQPYIQPKPYPQTYTQPSPYPQSYNQPKPNPQTYNQPKPNPQTYNTPQSYNQPKPSPKPYDQPPPYYQPQTYNKQQTYDQPQTYIKQQTYNQSQTYNQPKPYGVTEQQQQIGSTDSCISQDMTCPICHDNFEDMTSDVYCISPKTLLIRITKGIKDDGFSQCSSGFVTSLYDVTASKGALKSVLNVIYTIPRHCPCQMLAGDHFGLMLFTNDIELTNPLRVHLSSQVHLYSLINRKRVNLPFCQYASQYTQARSAAMPTQLIVDPVDKELMELRDQEMQLSECPADGCPVCQEMEHDELQKLVCSSENTLLVSTFYDSQMTRPKQLTNRKITLSQKAEHNYSVEIVIGNEDPQDVNLCSQPYDKGTVCTSKSNRKYYYDSATESCEEFDYLGCDGNANRFDSEEDCNLQCTREAKCKEGSVSFTRVIKKDISLYLDYDKFEYLLPEDCSCQYIEKEKQRSYIIFNDTIDEEQDGSFLLTKHYYIVPADTNNDIDCDKVTTTETKTDDDEPSIVKPTVIDQHKDNTANVLDHDSKSDGAMMEMTAAKENETDEAIRTGKSEKGNDKKTTEDNTYGIKNEDDPDEPSKDNYLDATPDDVEVKEIDGNEDDTVNEKKATDDNKNDTVNENKKTDDNEDNEAFNENKETDDEVSGSYSKDDENNTDDEIEITPRTPSKKKSRWGIF